MTTLNRCLLLVVTILTGWTLAGAEAVNWLRQYPEAEAANLLANDTQRLLGETQLEAKETLALLSRTVDVDSRLIGQLTVRDLLSLNKIAPEFCASVMLKIRLELCQMLMRHSPEAEPEQEAQMRANVVYWCRKSLEDFVAEHCNESALKMDLGEPEFNERLAKIWLEFSHKKRVQLSANGEKYFPDLLASEMTEFEQFIRDYQA